MFEELLPVVNENGEVIGSATRAECHNGSKLLHPVVHLHIFDSENNLFLQRRSETKKIQPGKWDTAVGGHVDLGESVIDALMRETFEEMGLSGFEPVHLATYIFESDVERELIHSFCVRGVDKSMLNHSRDEIDEIRAFSANDILEYENNGKLTPNFIYEYKSLFMS